jgi:hypothetical protein
VSFGLFVDSGKAHLQGEEATPVSQCSPLLKSLAARINHARVSSIRIGSCFTEQRSFRQNGVWQRCAETEATLKCFPAPDEHICGGTCAAKHLISKTAAPALWWCRIWHHNHQVVITVGPGIAPCPGIKEVDPLGLVCRDQATDDFSQRLIFQNSRRLCVVHIPFFRHMCSLGK